MRIKSKVCIVVLASLFIMLIIAFPEISSDGVTRGLLISANVIIPSLFPFMVFVLMLIKSGFCIKNSFINGFLYKVFGQNFDMFFVFILSLIGGYPIGARLINELKKQNSIDVKTANIMLLYCVNAGPAFIISAIGGAVFNSHKIGTVLLLSHIFSSVIIALFCSKKLKKHNCHHLPVKRTAKSISETFVESVADASGSLINICSFVIIFSVINAFFDFFFRNLPIIRYISFFTEVTSAVANTHNLVFVSFLLGFSGIAIWCQIFALLKECRINIFHFCLGRISHGIISMIITKLIITVFKIKISTFSNNINFKNEMLYSNTVLFSAMIIMLIVLMTFIYSKNNSGKILNDMI